MKVYIALSLAFTIPIGSVAAKVDLRGMDSARRHIEATTNKAQELERIRKEADEVTERAEQVQRETRIREIKKARELHDADRLRWSSPDTKGLDKIRKRVQRRREQEDIFGPQTGGIEELFPGFHVQGRTDASRKNAQSQRQAETFGPQTGCIEEVFPGFLEQRGRQTHEAE